MILSSIDNIYKKSCFWWCKTKPCIASTQRMPALWFARFQLLMCNYKLTFLAFSMWVACKIGMIISCANGFLQYVQIVLDYLWKCSSKKLQLWKEYILSNCMMYGNQGGARYIKVLFYYFHLYAIFHCIEFYSYWYPFHYFYRMMAGRKVEV